MSEDKFDYEELGLMMGLEIHQQLDSQTKLFCRCPNSLTDKDPERKIYRRLRPTQSELGEIDRAAYEESQRNLQFVYEAYNHHTCLVEADEEPPAELNQEAVDISIILASLMHMKVVDEFHTMRKQVIDGSNTSGFQRTGILATDGYVTTEYGNVTIETLGLEEDAARRIGEEEGKIVFRLDRLGIPLAEITTSPDMHHPLQVKEVAYQLGQILRSTRVKRGLGTIRQDLNISIKDGARIEVKGVQDLDLMPTMVENEVQRQVTLIEISKELQKRGAEVETEIYDVTEDFANTESKIVKGILEKPDSCVLAIRLRHFDGLIGKEIQPGKRLGTEFSEHGKKMGVTGLFHTDELPAYGITQEEVDHLKDKLELGDDDSFILVAGKTEKANNALHEIIKRAKQSIEGVPEETRRAQDDGNTEYLRPLPTASRMYVETDIPTEIIEPERVKKIASDLPELPYVKQERIQKEYNLSEDLAGQLVQHNNADLFEEIKKELPGMDSVKIASDIAYTIKDLKRDHYDIEKLTKDVLVEIFKLVDEDIISAAETEVILKDACNDIKPIDSVKNNNLEKLSDDVIESAIKEIIEENKDMIEQRKMGAMGPLMGKAMAKFKGKADGQTVSNIVKNEILNIVNN
ncbi:Glu-tRNA(Gln) amidotransferase subunit GatE [Candidatus Methanosphaera massiliense]|uniref:Glu-tRNA(Gln) amidotransferase subunit GatE n=1 Tax=Methanosphaera TaxID=2316 RepID=UPI0023802145|nr:Glu-tRNA(Gln) amidotransferase subunit GatE [Candidatus Methanosphaera massiliense]MDD6286031.1 Glu-tRNA(Gln) amidotransferase subunit GatE [Methanobacteriaceae archaeon]MDE4077804.1 Glu-tRNA(Gln) amidotransferase subunit GatE [Candidatus Methanosphaera massiliense]